jgi:hypothetical protein
VECGDRDRDDEDEDEDEDEEEGLRNAYQIQGLPVTPESLPHGRNGPKSISGT